MTFAKKEEIEFSLLNLTNINDVRKLIFQFQNEKTFIVSRNPNTIFAPLPSRYESACIESWDDICDSVDNLVVLDPFATTQLFKNGKIKDIYTLIRKKLIFVVPYYKQKKFTVLFSSAFSYVEKEGEEFSRWFVGDDLHPNSGDIVFINGYQWNQKMKLTASIWCVDANAQLVITLDGKRTEWQAEDHMVFLDMVSCVTPGYHKLTLFYFGGVNPILDVGDIRECKCKLSRANIELTGESSQIISGEELYSESYVHDYFQFLLDEHFICKLLHSCGFYHVTSFLLSAHTVTRQLESRYYCTERKYRKEMINQDNMHEGVLLFLAERVGPNEL